MNGGEPTPDEQAILRLLRAAARIRAQELGITTTDYLVGILEGRFPAFSQEQISLVAASEAQREVAAQN